MMLLQGKYTELADAIREKMLASAEALDFEQAALLRDRLRAVESLGQKQLVTAGSMANTDVIGYYQSEAKACFAVLHYVDGNLLDKDYEILQPSDEEEDAMGALVKQYYLARGAAPKGDSAAEADGRRGAFRGASVSEPAEEGPHPHAAARG